MITHFITHGKRQTSRLAWRNQYNAPSFACQKAAYDLYSVFLPGRNLVWKMQLALKRWFSCYTGRCLLARRAQPQTADCKLPGLPMVHTQPYPAFQSQAQVRHTGENLWFLPRFEQNRSIRSYFLARKDLSRAHAMLCAGRLSRCELQSHSWASQIAS